MPSEFAKRLASQLPEAQFIGRSALRDYVPRQQMVDAELQEVRALVADVAALETNDDDEYGLGQRARKLMKRLEVK